LARLFLAGKYYFCTVSYSVRYCKELLIVQSDLPISILITTAYLGYLLTADMHHIFSPALHLPCSSNSPDPTMT